MTIITCVFDAYGTLFDVAAAAREAAAEPDFTYFSDHWPEIANTWRLKQLQYTWLRAVSDHHIDFWQVTQDGLDFALEASGLGQDSSLRERLLALYWELSAYDEVPKMLAELKEMDLNTAILSNGSPEMLAGAVSSAGLSNLLDDSLSVEDVGIFKPHKSVYDLVGKRFDCTASEVLFVSSNGWDAAAASAYGFHSLWVNRAGDPMDRLAAKPHFVQSDLTQIPRLIGSIK